MLHLDFVKRFRNKAFLVSLVSAVVLLLQQLHVNIVPANWHDIFNTLLTILTIIGVVVDPTSPGISDKVETEAQG